MKQPSNQAKNTSKAAKTSTNTAPRSMGDSVLQWVNLLLMWNLFFVLACFAWFVVALIGQSADFPLGLELWYRLWVPVMQPAIGILMAGALAIGGFNWVSRKLQSD